jgi:hypothetical protein
MNYLDFTDKHKGETIIVAGCGSSAAHFPSYDRFTTIGVNDIGRLFTPDYLVVLNDRRGFKGDRWKHVKMTKAKNVFTHFKSDKNLDINNPNIVRFTLGSHGGLNINDRTKVDHTSNSPYVACIIAYHMGAKRIGLIGVDFTPNHFFGKTGRHSLHGRIPNIIQEYGKLKKAFQDNGVDFFNLSSSSVVNTVPKKPIETFLKEEGIQ